MARCPVQLERRDDRASRLPALAWGRAGIIAFALVGTLVGRIAQAQQPVSASPQWEGRLDAVLSPGAGALAGVGMNVRAGWYARVGAGISAGAVQRRGAWESRQRVDATARFLFDPFAERRRGFYAGAGLGAERRAGGEVRGLLLGVVGVEGATGARLVSALELQLGGGVRLGVVLRERRRQGR